MEATAARMSASSEAAGTASMGCGGARRKAFRLNMGVGSWTVVPAISVRAAAR
jgi:hypothetical protein